MRFCMSYFLYRFGLITIFLTIIFFPRSSGAQEGIQEKVNQLEERVHALEDYVQKLEDSLNQISDKVQSGFKDYSKELNKSLESFTRGLQTNLNDRLAMNTSKVAVLNPISKEYTRVDSNSGTFLLLVNKIGRSENGYKLDLLIGNPNVATYKGVELTIRWGNKWDPNSIRTYEEWRQSLNQAQFAYHGSLISGMWTPITVDLSPSTVEQLEHIECALEVKTIELKSK